MFLFVPRPLDKRHDYILSKWTIKDAGLGIVSSYAKPIGASGLYRDGLYNVFYIRSLGFSCNIVDNKYLASL